MARDWAAAWEEAAAELGLDINERIPGRKAKPTEMRGTVEGFDLTISTWVETSSGAGGGSAAYTGYEVAFSSPVGPAGFEAKIRGRLYWKSIGNRSGRIRRVEQWAITADDTEELGAWLSAPLPAYLTSSHSDRTAVFEKLRSNSFTTRWEISADALSVKTRGRVRDKAVIISYAQAVVAAAEALSI